MKLQKYLSALALVLLSLTFLTSCMDDDDEVTLDDRCYISSFKLGNMKRIMHIKASDGSDSTYSVALDASVFPMDIDQRNLTIENNDSLPYGTKLNAVLANISYTGILGYKQAGATELTAYSSKDSIDFTSPVEFVVYAQNGNGERHYTVKLNVHKLDGTQFDWHKTNGSDALSTLTERAMVVRKKQLLIMGKTAMGAVMTASRSNDLLDEWKLKAATGADEADVRTLQVAPDGGLLMSTTRGALLHSTDGKEWTPLTEGLEKRVLAGVNGTCIYAIMPRTLQSSTDNGQTWKEEALDGNASYLPDYRPYMVFSQQENGQNRLVLMGQPATSAKTAAEVWSKVWSLNSKEQEAIWMYYPHTHDNTLLCPLFSPMFVLPYDKGLVAFGGKTLDGQKEALSTMLYSPDYGLTWQKHEEMVLPEEMKGCEGALSATVDDENFIWITAGKDTWRGRLVRLGFE